jgi:hypothetical protein
MLCRTGGYTRCSSEICLGSLLRGVLPVAKARGDLLTRA